MALILLGFLFLIQSSNSVETHLGVCGSDRVGFVKSSDGYQLFVNEKRVEDQFLICEALGFYFGRGCLFDAEEWGSIWEKHCDRKFSRQSAISANFRQVEGRKLLQRTPANTSISNQLHRKDQQEEKTLAPATMALAIPGAFLLCCALMCPCFYAKKKESSEQNIMSTEMDLNSVSTLEEKTPASPLGVPLSPSRFAMSPQLNRMGSIHLSVSQIMKATHDFSPSLKLGEGTFGTVYKAVLPNGQIVAVKRAKKEQFSSLRDEFSNEVELLRKIDHRNLVKLLGYTEKGNERIVITEYVPNGTLREHLDGQHGKILDFNQRLEIAIDVAHALTYLHLYAEKPIIHRDVKSSNIMLTESFRGKVSDLGFARIGPTEAEQTHILTQVKGTAGYLDPEYLKTYKLTSKSDVFSFGILLIEILSARRPVELKKSNNERITVRWAFKNYNEGHGMAILDPMLKEAVDGEVVMKMLDLAFQCSAPTRADRPEMKEVGEKLWEIRKLYGRTRRGR
ncbi:calmodulin-binding receptor-like cytoplasmic kinase 3 isoform X1 [Asparagus officinalis]|uniref:calmodulin-binding receptor-like cytoplasmic kinase 3 isoform X1 n=1 Tax=Asparagus officinalis TaxID=4686 RepID=UPI00098E0EE7|nr:calmodulin-binding receptor-like cytoplasmic kinase 3 isoform X1 [Asparagus officinalis]